LALLPEKKHKFSTKIKNHDLDPFFDETFLFNVSFNELQRKTLQIVVFDFDRLSKDDRLGQISIPLDTIDFGELLDQWRDLGAPDHLRDDAMVSRRLHLQRTPSYGLRHKCHINAKILTFPCLGISSGRYLLFDEVQTHNRR
jgi:Ca2+-dependent lipid-binding protein